MRRLMVGPLGSWSEGKSARDVCNFARIRTSSRASQARVVFSPNLQGVAAEAFMPILEGIAEASVDEEIAEDVLLNHLLGPERC